MKIALTLGVSEVEEDYFTSQPDVYGCGILRIRNFQRVISSIAAFVASDKVKDVVDYDWGY